MRYFVQMCRKVERKRKERLQNGCLLFMERTSVMLLCYCCAVAPQIERCWQSAVQGVSVHRCN